jgi:hypothetical protein
MGTGTFSQVFNQLGKVLSLVFEKRCSLGWRCSLDQVVWCRHFLFQVHPNTHLLLALNTPFHHGLIECIFLAQLPQWGSLVFCYWGNACASQSKKLRLMNFLDALIAVLMLMEMVVYRQLFFVSHEKRPPKMPRRWLCGDSSLHGLRHQLHPQRGANTGNRVKAWVRSRA